MRTYLRFAASCIQCSPSCVVLAPAVSCDSAIAVVACSALSVSVG